MTDFKKPFEVATPVEKARGKQPFFPSSRVLALVNGTSKSIGASCNVFQVSDSLESIGASIAWTYSVLGYQGAPSVYYQLRAEGEPLSTGGTSSGLVAFAEDFDRVVSHMRRAEKKNGAGLASIDYSHKELDKFLAADFKAAYKAVYVPSTHSPEMEKLLKDTKMLNKLAKAYNNFQTFLVKRPLPYGGEPLMVNLCTEVEIPHMGTCVLGAINLSYFKSIADLARDLTVVMSKAVVDMIDYKRKSELAMRSSPLWCYSKANNQFGLGLFGLASFLAQVGVTYEELASAFLEIAGIDKDVHEMAEFLHEVSKSRESKAFSILYALYRAYANATLICEDKVRAAFCFQPTVSTSQIAFTAEGYNVSAELQPVIGLAHEDAVTTQVKSQLRGDKLLHYHPDTETIFSVPYEVYLDVARGFQQLIDSTGLGHRHSLCYYGEKFTRKELVSFLRGNEKSLYYRLNPNQNVEALKKDVLWQTIEEGELTEPDFNLDNIGRQQLGEIECDCAM